MPDVKQKSKVLQIIFVGSLAPALLISLVLALAWTDYIPFLFILIGYTFVGHYLIRYLGERGKNAEWFISIAVLHLLLLTPETALRLYQFQYDTGIQFAYPRSFQKFVPHEELFWTLPPGQEGINSLGFPDAEIEVPKPANVCRTLFLGDSVPMQGYPKVVERILKEQQIPAQSVSLALAGYATYQGRVLVDKYGPMIAPDVVVVVYGWNDHWLAYGAIDSQKKIDINLRQQVSSYLYTNVRILQGIRYLLIPLMGKDIPLTELRVPLAEYIANLTYIGEFFEAKGVPVIFITPPTTYYDFDVPDYLIEQGFAVDKKSVIQLHRQYNQSLRELTSAKGWLTLESEQEFESSPDLGVLFLEDGIHLTAFGVETMGQHIADFIVGESCLVP